MVQNKEIKMCVLGISGPFQATYEFWSVRRYTDNEVSHLYFFIMDHFQAIYSHIKSYKSRPTRGSPVRWRTAWLVTFTVFRHINILQTTIVCQYYSLRGLRKHRFLVLPKTLWFIDLPCVVPQPDPRSGWVGHVACCAALIHCTVWLMSWRKRISQAKGKVWFQLFKALIKLNPGSNLILVSISWPTNKRF